MKAGPSSARSRNLSKDYTDDAVFKNIASKYCTQPQKRSTLHAATLQAVLTYMELEESAGGKSAEELGAIGEPDQYLYSGRISQPYRRTSCGGL